MFMAITHEIHARMWNGCVATLVRNMPRKPLALHENKSVACPLQITLGFFLNFDDNHLLCLIQQACRM